MAKFRKKPVEIEAIRFQINFDEIEEFVGGDAEFRNGELIVATLEGPLRAAPGDWIIKGVAGEFYPCKPDIFEATYDPVCRQGTSKANYLENFMAYDDLLKIGNAYASAVSTARKALEAGDAERALEILKEVEDG